MLFQHRRWHSEDIDIAERRKRCVHRHFLNVGILPRCVEFAQPEVVAGAEICQRPLAIAVFDADARKAGANHQHAVRVFALPRDDRLLAAAALPLPLKRDIPVERTIGFKQNLVGHRLQTLFIEARKHHAFLQMGF